MIGLLDAAIGEVDQTNAKAKTRIERYKAVCRDEFGYQMPEYDEFERICKA